MIQMIRCLGQGVGKGCKASVPLQVHYLPGTSTRPATQTLPELCPFGIVRKLHKRHDSLNPGPLKINSTVSPPAHPKGWEVGLKVAPSNHV
jgi:hypothetical protein